MKTIKPKPWTPGRRAAERRAAAVVTQKAEHLADVVFYPHDSGGSCPSSPKLTEWYVKAYLNANSATTGLKS